MAGIPPAYPQYSQPIPPAQPYQQYLQQYPPPPPPPQQYGLYPPKPQMPIRTKILYRYPPKPSNSIYIKNIPYDLTNEEFLNIYSKFGEIASSTNRIKGRGMAFITYYNIHSAIDAIEQMKSVKVHDRIPTTTFAFKAPPYSGIDPKMTSTIVEVQPIQPASQVLTQDQVSQVLSNFGQIYQINEVGPNHITVQFCDMRDAKKAAESGTNIEINGIKCKVELYVEPTGDAIIQPILPPQQYPQQRVPPGPPPSQIPISQQIPPPPPPSYQQMPPPSYQQPPPPPPQQIQQMPIPPPPPQYSQQIQMPQYGTPQQMQPYQYGSIPPPPPPSQPNQPAQNNSPQNTPYQTPMLSSIMK